MIELLLKVFPYVAGVLVIFLFGSTVGKNKYKKQAEEEIRKANQEAGKAKAEAKAAEKEKRILETAAKSVSPVSAPKEIKGDTRERVLEAIDELIKESKSK